MKETKKKQQFEIEPIDVNDPVAKTEAGILWCTPGFVRDSSVWTKTAKEKAALKKARHKVWSPFLSSWGFTKNSIPCYGNVIVQLNVSKKENKHWLEKHGYKASQTTISIECGQSDIPQILGRFVVTKTTKDGQSITSSLVNKYKWNGKWYSPSELPFYYW